ncbi:MAG: extracellular solute-binding protein [Treponema sp.]|jgi:putative aldouronate transport system substrate-binding protein|nr:extracellular solute-binding protein [Treponema sp.]
MKFKKCGFLLILPLLTLMAGCGGKNGGSQGAPDSGAGGPVSYPVKTGVTLTWWQDMNANVSPNFTNLGDSPFGKGLQERTGIKISFQHPPSGGVNEQFNLLVADGNLPDIMERNWLEEYPGGPEKAIADGVIIKLNGIIEKYAPNLNAYLKAHPDIDRMVKTDNGSYYCFPFIRGDPGLLVSRGLIVRQDWLDELGLSVPETIEEWHTVLTAFKTRKNSRAPFTFEYTTSGLNDVLGFALAYKAPRIFFVGEDGKIRFGAVEKGRRDYLATMARWYKEGLIDPDIASLQLQQVSAKMTGDQSGASMGWLGSRLGVWTNAAIATNPAYRLTATPFPVLRKGDKPLMSSTELPYAQTGSAAITGSCENVEIAARLLDWAYSPEGHLFYNFGIEGESYNMVDGYPAYTDIILKNPQGWPVAQGLGAYVRSVYNGPFVQDIRYFDQYMTLPAQKEGYKTWAIEGALKYVLPTITPTPEESREFARIMNEINTYRDEMELKFILGTEDLSIWDSYVSTIQKMGLDRAQAIQEAAMTRYNAR